MLHRKRYRERFTMIHHGAASCAANRLAGVSRRLPDTSPALPPESSTPCHSSTADAAPVLLVAEYLCLDQCVSPPPYFTLIGASSVQPQRFWTVTPIVAGRAAESYGVNFSSSPQSRSQSWFR